MQVDDRIVIEHYKDRKNSVVVAVDKDALGTGVVFTTQIKRNGEL